VGWNCPIRSPSPPELRAVLAQVTDPRKPRGVRHGLVVVLTTAVCAVAAGARSFVAIAEWVADIPATMAEHLGTAQRWPSESTIRRVVPDVDADRFDAALAIFVQQQSSAQPPAQNFAPSDAWTQIPSTRLTRPGRRARRSSGCPSYDDQPLKGPRPVSGGMRSRPVEDHKRLPGRSRSRGGRRVTVLPAQIQRHHRSNAAANCMHRVGVTVGRDRAFHSAQRGSRRNSTLRAGRNTRKRFGPWTMWLLEVTTARTEGHSLVSRARSRVSPTVNRVATRDTSLDHSSGGRSCHPIDCGDLRLRF
jgi:hypothetical protein